MIWCPASYPFWHCTYFMNSSKRQLFILFCALFHIRFSSSEIPDKQFKQSIGCSRVMNSIQLLDSLKCLQYNVMKQMACGLSGSLNYHTLCLMPISTYLHSEEDSGYWWINVICITFSLRSEPKNKCSTRKCQKLTEVTERPKSDTTMKISDPIRACMHIQKFRVRCFLLF